MSYLLFALALALGAFIAGGIWSDRQWMRRGDMERGLMVRDGRAFMVVDVDDPHACNAAREQLEDAQDRMLRRL